MKSILQSHSNFKPQTIVLLQCVLKADLLHFPTGTKFDEVHFNENGVIQFYIRDDDKLNVFKNSGYWYNGHWGTHPLKRMLFTQSWKYHLFNDRLHFTPNVNAIPNAWLETAFDRGIVNECACMWSG